MNAPGNYGTEIKQLGCAEFLTYQLHSDGATKDINSESLIEQAHGYQLQLVMNIKI